MIRRQLEESAAVKQAVARDLAGDIARAAARVTETLRQGGLVVLCGNGGSAADCQHLAAELVGRFRRERAAYNVMALTTNASVLTALGNDYGYDVVFRRQVQAHLKAGDLLVALSTSGNAANCLAAAQVARDRQVYTVGLTGADGGMLRSAVDLCLCVPSHETPRIQEAHLTIGHIICDLVEQALAS